MRKTHILSLISIFLLLVLAGCSPSEKLEQSSIAGTQELNSQGSIGQTFVSHYNGLMGVSIYLEPLEPGNGTITLQINTNPAEPEELGAGRLHLSSVTSPGFYPIDITPLSGSTQTYYYLVLTIEGSGRVNVGTAPGNTYINGALYQNLQPQDAQLSFNLRYEPVSMILGLAKEALTWIGYLFVGVFLFVIPGWAVLSLSLPNWVNKDLLVKTTLSTGVSLSIYPVLILWTDFIGLHLGALYAWLPPLIGLSALIWRYRNRVKNISEIKLKFTKLSWSGFILIFTIGLVFAVRFWVIRGLEAPVGGDSLHHTIITQLMLDNNGLPTSWRPYSELSSFTYHFGFHSATAVYAWLTNMPTMATVLIVGQILNGLAVLAIYPLAKKIIGNGNSGSWAGMISIILAGLLFPMPMYYLNWGRYTQLTSQIILPIAALLIWDLLGSKKIERSVLIITWITIAGLGLTHYRIFLFLLFLFPTLWMFNSSTQSKSRLIWESIKILLGGVLLFLPWLIKLIPQKLSKIAWAFLTTPVSEVSPTVRALKDIDLSTYLPGWAWISLAFAVGWGLWHQKKNPMIITFWWFLILLAANPSWLNLPGEGLISHGAVITGAYIPASVLISMPLGYLLDRLRESAPRRYLVITMIGLIITIIWGTQQRRHDFNPNAIYVTRPDVVASSWIITNIPPDEIFLVNTNTLFNADWWQVGTDGGWWLPVLSGHKTTTQHMMYTMETETHPERQSIYNSLLKQISQSGITNPDVFSQLDTLDISYLFIGQRGNDFMGTPIFTLLEDPRFTPIYHQNRVWVFKILD